MDPSPRMDSHAILMIPYPELSYSFKISLENLLLTLFLNLSFITLPCLILLEFVVCFISLICSTVFSLISVHLVSCICSLLLPGFSLKTDDFMTYMFYFCCLCEALLESALEIRVFIITCAVLNVQNSQHCSTCICFVILQNFSVILYTLTCQIGR